MSGGNYTIDGGFWGIIAAVQTPGAPLLSIARTTTNTVAVFWPSPSTGFTLQQNTNSISSVNWSNVVTAPSDDGTTPLSQKNPSFPGPPPNPTNQKPQVMPGFRRSNNARNRRNVRGLSQRQILDP